MGRRLRRGGVDYWRQLGVEILQSRVDDYVMALRARLARSGSIDGRTEADFAPDPSRLRKKGSRQA